MARILFLYATNNSGHQKAAEGIIKSLHEIAPGTITDEIDFFTYHYPKIGPFIFKMYLEVLQSIPNAWNIIYDDPNLAALSTELRQFFHLINTPKLHELFDERKPDAIVCTQAVPAGFVAAEKEQGRISLPLFITVTDFVANPYWPARQVDCYFVPDDEIRTSLVLRGIPEDRIRVTGIPIDPQFASRAPKPSARRRLGLCEDIPVILLMGGSQGLGGIEEAVENLFSLDIPFQLVVAAGTNKELVRLLKRRYGTLRRALFLGYTRNISRIMDAADIIVTKPGGITSAEAIAKGLPMVIIRPLPGQEERNASFLVRHGVAERCSDMGDLPRIVESFIIRPQKMRRFQARIQSIAHPLASREIANHIHRKVYHDNLGANDDRVPTAVAGRA